MVGELGLNAVISAGAVVFAAFFMLPSLASSVMRDNLFHVLVNLGQSVSGYASARADPTHMPGSGSGLEVGSSEGRLRCRVGVRSGEGFIIHHVINLDVPLQPKSPVKHDLASGGQTV